MQFIEVKWEAGYSIARNKVIYPMRIDVRRSDLCLRHSIKQIIMESLSLYARLRETLHIF
ncbi:hypothetical protein SAMN05518684_11579 [Salipaludibacillus aurantiacus]|uniref:Uncharacterized protein n=1 Tax=Salipaludibacillus aurantiacus TaxID=1601833 RepID=A0A1H9W9X7_9BACI|nr:hypothetical protein SAMN05518684_11579 [Salipaludibacillus aurantiacus]